MIATVLDTARASNITPGCERFIPLLLDHAGKGLMGYLFCGTVLVECYAETVVTT